MKQWADLTSEQRCSAMRLVVKDTPRAVATGTAIAFVCVAPLFLLGLLILP